VDTGESHFAVSFGVIAIAIATFGVYEGELRAIIGGFGYLGSAVVLYGVVKQREGGARDA